MTELCGVRRICTAMLCAAGLFAPLTHSLAQQESAHPCPTLTEARQLVQQQQWAKADRFLENMVSYAPACPDTYYLLGYVLLRANQPESSLKAYTVAARLRPPSSDDFVAVASDYILLKSYADAERWLHRAVETAPVSSQAWYLLGRTQYNLDKNAAAVDSFQRSLTLQPQDPRSEYNLGLAYERLQQPDKARAAYLTAIQWGELKHQLDAQPYLDLALLTRSQGHPEEALPLLQKAAALSPDNAYIFQELGRTLNDLHHTDEAIDALNRAIALTPSAEQPHFFLGRIYRATGKTREADEQFAIVNKLLGNQSSSATPNADGPR